MFGIYPQMYSLHLKFREKSKVSGVEMFLVPFRRGPTASEGARLGRGGANPGRKEREGRPAPVGALPPPSGCLSVTSAQQVVAPLFVSAGVH